MGNFFNEEVLSVNPTTSVGLTPSKYDNSGSTRASRVDIQVGSTAIYYSFDSSEPSATNGFVANIGDIVGVNGFENLVQLKIIGQTGSGTVYVAYES